MLTGFSSNGFHWHVKEYLLYIIMKWITCMLMVVLWSLWWTRNSWSIHSFIVQRVYTRGLEARLGGLGGNPWPGIIACTLSFTHFRQFRNASQPTMHLDWRRRMKYPEETFRAPGEHPNSRVEAGIYALNPEVQGKHASH